MKSMLAIALFACAIAASSAAMQCNQTPLDMPMQWKDMQESCVDKVKQQIGEELKASMQYLAMGAHFSDYQINRPGFAKMFFESASEERDHAIKLISYLLMRGELRQDVSNLIKKKYTPAATTWASGMEALKDALALEASVTKKIRDVVKVCEDDERFNDYHLVDYLTGEFLEEQYKGQREIAGRISTLGKMMSKHSALGEFLYDKKLLS
ncbi:PREDICTED: ferritin subunit [Nicrophorus vespilloides]|uniref:Ferritin n=1 Tax=Nicrophorus vespilloides TaxID=110193 RepID=A0ABM1M6Y0_NICVS|nr:PREDICTED: ferritin subunit [Nicrophorus vespilloides]